MAGQRRGLCYAAAMRGAWLTAMKAGGAAALLLAGVAASAHDAVAVFDDWGAFRDPPGLAAERCYAIAQPPPISDAAGHGAFAAVSAWPASRIRGQVSIRLSRGHRAGARVTLSIGDAAFVLLSAERDAFAHDRYEDAQIVRAMRSGSSMSVATIAADGAPYADVYRLRGAASAIDAAMLACGEG